MASRYDFKKDWPYLKDELKRISEEAMKMVKKGEEEITRYSQIGIMHLDATALKLKKEHLYHLVGKEYVQAGCPKEPTAKLQKYLVELKKIDKDIKDLGTKVAAKAQKGKSPAKKKLEKKVTGQTEVLPQEDQPLEQ